jgi:GTP cyclohydrolase I
MFARRLQVLERLTEQVAKAVEAVLALRGVFRDDGKTRDEFLRLAYDSASRG